ncbi:hypothetical protein [Hydrogenophaga defluvii]|uniref:Uncharacterized protein n=1 Tax=Hydrogenophaga defluvii TaxID=249410 RepID=A0ABW2SFC9_9BURK
MIQDFLSSFFGAAFGLSLIAFLGRTWIEARVRGSINQQYKTQFELFQRSLNRKEKVAIVAQLLAEYMKTPYGETIEREQRTLLNRLSLEATLWLPSELALEISKRLQNAPDAKTPFELIVLARHHLSEDDSLSVEAVTIWGWDREKSAEPIFAVARK